MSFSLLPPWILQYLTEGGEFIHNIIATMKVRGTKSQYRNFIVELRKTLTTMQCESLG